MDEAMDEKFEYKIIIKKFYLKKMFKEFYESHVSISEISMRLKLKPPVLDTFSRDKT